MRAELFDAVAKASHAAHTAWCPKEIVYGVGRAVAVAVQLGNAQIAFAAVDRANRARDA